MLHSVKYWDAALFVIKEKCAENFLLKTIIYRTNSAIGRGIRGRENVRVQWNRNSKLSYTPQFLTLDNTPWFPLMGEIHYSRVSNGRWEEELYKMKAGGIELVSAYTIWIHHEEVEGEGDFSGDRDLRKFLQTIKNCGLHCILRIGPWAHGEVRNGGFPDWLMQKEKEGQLVTRTNDPKYLRYVREFYGKIAEQARGLLLSDDGPVAMIQIENEYGHVGGRTGEEGEAHMRMLRQVAKEVGLKVPIYTATGWGGAVTGGMLPVMGGYCEAPWDQRLTEIEPSGNYLFTEERNDHNIGSDHGIGGGITFDMEQVPYLTAELGGGLQVTKHRRPVVSGRDTEAMTFVKLGSGCNLLGYYMYHGGTNPEGKRTTLQESRETGYPNDLPVKNYDFNAPIREYGQLSDSYRRIRRLSLFLHDFGSDLAQMPYIPQPRNPGKPENFSALRTAVRYNTKTGTGFLFVNNYVRHYPMSEHLETALQAFGKDGREVYADFGKQDIRDGDYFFYPFRMPLGERAVLEKARAIPLCMLRNEKGEPDTYVFYTRNGVDPDFCVSGDASPITILTLSEEEALHAQKIIRDGRELLVISEMDLYQRENGTIAGLLRTKKTAMPEVRVYPLPEHAIFKMEQVDANTFRSCESVSNPVRCRLTGRMETDDGTDLVLSIHVEGIRKELEEALLILNYEGESAELYQDGRLVADSFYTGQSWEIGLKELAHQQEADLIVVIHPLKESAGIYLEKWPVMKHHRACRLVNAETAAIIRVE